MPIQSAVGWWPAAIMIIRSWAISSSVKPYGLASRRETTSSAGYASRACEQAAHRRHQVPLARRARLLPVDHVVRRGDQARRLLVGEAEEPGHDPYRQPHRVLLDEVRLAPRTDRVDQLVRELLGVRPQFDRVGTASSALPIIAARSRWRSPTV